MNSNIKTSDKISATVLRGGGQEDMSKIIGHFAVRCLNAKGEVKWDDVIKNTVMTLGKNLILDQAWAGAGYTAAFYMGLISSVGYVSVPVVGDTMASHATWAEAGSGGNFPLYTTPRKTCAWSAAAGGVKALSAALNFPIITTGGTIKGAFIVGGAGAVSTIADTNGVLTAAGLFSGGDKVVQVGDTVQVSYSSTLT